MTAYAYVGRSLDERELRVSGGGGRWRIALPDDAAPRAVEARAEYGERGDVASIVGVRRVRSP